MGPTAALDRALDLVRFLRANCSWDAEQTPRSLVRHLLEETHEVVDAIHGEDPDSLRDELGDLLLNLAFQVVIGEERGHFDAETVTVSLEEKMRRRHPHLYGLGEAESWEGIKARERAKQEGDTSRLDGIPKGLDAAHRAHRLQERAASVGFDWPNADGAWAKVREECAEVEASTGGPQEAEELGDLLFALVNVVRLRGHHAADLLQRANTKFERRFRDLEHRAHEEHGRLEGLSLAEMDALWDRIKERESSEPEAAHE